MSGPSCLMALMGHVSQGCQGICANVRGLVQSSNPHLFAPWTLAQYIYIFTVYVCVCDHIIYLNLYIYNYQYHIVSHIFEQCLSFLHATTSCKEEERANHSMMAHNWSAHVCQTELGASCHRPALLQTSMAAVVLLVVCKLCLHISFSNCSAHSCEIMAPATETTWTVAERCIYYIIL